jgi:hypothetical protein
MAGEMTDLDDIRARHKSDPYRNGFCLVDGDPWPCDVTQALAEVDRLRRSPDVLRELDLIGRAARAEAEVDRLADDPQWDATEGAHPAWWRGCDHGVARERARIHAAVEGLVREPHIPDWPGENDYQRGYRDGRNQTCAAVHRAIDEEPR